MTFFFASLSVERYKSGHGNHIGGRLQTDNRFFYCMTCFAQCEWKAALSQSKCWKSNTFCANATVRVSVPIGCSLWDCPKQARLFWKTPRLSARPLPFKDWSEQENWRDLSSSPLLLVISLHHSRLFQLKDWNSTRLLPFCRRKL